MPVVETKSEAPVVSSSAVPAIEDPAEEEDVQAGNGDEQMYGNNQDDNDEIDFNLGNGGGHSHEYDDAPQQQRGNGPGIKEDG